MACFQLCLGFIWTPISGALEFLSQAIRAEAVLSLTSMFLLSSRAEDLVYEIRDLKDTRKDMEVQIDRGRLQNMMPSSRANTWLEEEEEVQSDAAEFKDSLDGMEGFSLRSYYQLGRSAEKILTRARRLKAQMADIPLLIEAPPDRVVPQPGFSHEIVDLEDVQLKIWRLLEDEDSKIIGIYGMGGVGKTTLLNEINNKFLQTKSGRFDLVVFVTVSKEVCPDRIQKDIAARLGYSPTGPQLPGDPVDRATNLHTALLRKKFLLLLDDLWEKLDLAKLGIPVSPLSKGSKIVFTTRSTEVCNNMGAAFHKVKVPCLSQQSSWKLFCQKLGKKEEDEWAGSTRALAEAVAAKCGGLPLALITVGRAMADATTDGEWKEALTTLRGTTAELGDMEKDVLTLLKFSFDGLKDERYKQCLLYCSLFPEDHNVDIENLIDLWAGEGFLESGRSPLPLTIDRARNRGRAAITYLKAACLLEDGHLVGKHVKLHDMIRETALWITGGTFEAENKIFWVDAGQRLTHVPMPGRWREATRISLGSNSISQLPENPHCPNLLTLLLYRNGPLTHIHDGFFQFMPILTVLDLSHTKLSFLPPEIGWVDELRLLNLSYTRLGSLPEELGKLRKLRQLNLEGLVFLRSIPQAAISSLSCLQSLKVHKGDYQWRVGRKDDDSAGGEVCLKDLDGLNRLDEVYISVFVNSQHDMQALRGSPRLCTAIRHVRLGGMGSDYNEADFSGTKIDLTDFLGAHEDLRKLRIANFHFAEALIFPANQITRLEELTLACFYRASILWGDDKELVSEPARPIPFINLLRVEIHHCGALKDITWVGQLPHLEVLMVWHCRAMVEIIAVEEPAITKEWNSFFPKLKTINLQGHPKLKSISRHPLLFPNLEKVMVIRCPMLKKLPFRQDSAKNIQSISGDLHWWRELVWEHKDIQSRFSAYY